MKLMLNNSQVLTAAAAGLATLAFAPTIFAQVGVCEALDLPGRKLFGAGGSAVTPTLTAIATQLASLPEDERVNIFYADGKAACGGLAYWLGTDTTVATYKYWDENGVQATCTDSPDLATFAHMGNTPALCPGQPVLPEGTARIVAPVMTLDFITHYQSDERSISQEALYHILGFGAGEYDIEPWNTPNAIFGRTLSSFVAQFASGAIGVPASSFKIPNGPNNDGQVGDGSVPINVFAQNSQVVSAVANWPTPAEALGFVSGSNATAGYEAQQTRTLAYQHTGQSCAYLPDSEEGKPDRVNVRSGQYYVWTPAWFYTEVDENGEPVDELTRDLIGWIDGSVEHPSIPVPEIVVTAGDIPLCAMQAIRPDGDFSEIQSFAPENPCNGWYEYVALGEETYQPCDTTSECDGAEQNDEGEEVGEQCRFGFCEAY